MSNGSCNVCLIGCGQRVCRYRIMAVPMYKDTVVQTQHIFNMRCLAALGF